MAAAGMADGGSSISKDGTTKNLTDQSEKVNGSADGGMPKASVDSIKGAIKDVLGITEVEHNQPKKSWINAVKNNTGLIRYDLNSQTLDGLAVVPDDVLGDSPLWEDFLVGRFFATAPHIAKIHVIVNKIWPLGDRTAKIDVYPIDEKAVRFRIRDPSIKLRVLRRGMWNIADIPMVITKWTPINEEAQPEIRTIPMWVILKKVPHSMFSWKGLSFIASKAGHPKRLHPDTEQCKCFEEAKVFVEVDLSKELPRSHKFNLKGVEVEVDFWYPWLPPRCATCEKWGHPTNRCNLTRSSRIKNVEPGILQEQVPSDSVEQPPVAVGERILLVENELPSVQLARNLQASLEEDKEEGEINEQAEIVQDVEDWNSVSPGKRGRRLQTEMRIDNTEKLVSPSRFSILENMEEEEASETVDDKSKESIEESTSFGKKSEKGTDVVKPDGVGSRPSLPRASKPKPGSVAQLIKNKSLGGVSKKGPSH